MQTESKEIRLALALR